MSSAEKKTNSHLPLIIGASVALPVLIAILYFSPKLKVEGIDFSILALVNATLNGMTTMMLIMGLMAVKSEIIILHKRFMSMALVFSCLFLLSYVMYHLTTESQSFDGEGFIRYVYFTILISHIVLAAAIVPLVLITYSRALSARYDKHRKIARITYPLWLYVSITGVIIYMMVHPEGD